MPLQEIDQEATLPEDAVAAIDACHERRLPVDRDDVGARQGELACSREESN